MTKQKKILIICATVTGLLLFVVAAVFSIKFFSASKERISESKRNPVPAGEARIFFYQEEYEERARKYEETWYLSLDAVTAKVNRLFFYDETEDILTLTTPLQIIRAVKDEKSYTVNKKREELSYVPVTMMYGNVYIALPFVELFSDLSSQFYENPDRLILQNGPKQMVCLKAKNDTVMRNAASRKEKIVQDIKKDDLFWYLTGKGESSKGYIRVMSLNGVQGYIREKDLSDSFFIDYDNDYVTPEYSHILSEEKMILGWHQVTNKSANAGLSGLIKGNNVMTAVSPTWFRIIDEDGNISSLAEESYVKTAKEAGLLVFGLADNFSKQVDTFQVLSSTSARDRLVNALLAEAIRYGLDGINIDFEMLSLETGPYFIEFLRELSTKCRANSLILSVDNYVPSAHAAYYDMKSQSEVVDYVVIMAYDEHYSGSKVAGSVASYGYLTSAVDNVLTLVPKEQVIMALPFYTRLWMETIDNGKSKLTSEALSMQAAEETLQKNGVTAEWNAENRQYYASYESKNATFRIWLEEEDSLREKLLYIKQAQLGGAAAWRLGFEKQEIWDLFDFENLVKKEEEKVEE